MNMCLTLTIKNLLLAASPNLKNWMRTTLLVWNQNAAEGSYDGTTFNKLAYSAFPVIVIELGMFITMCECISVHVQSFLA